MKNAIIFHGSGCTPNSYWIPWLKKELEKKGYLVFVPQLPDAEVPDIKKWLPFALKNFHFNSETVLIGHSSGGPLILSVLESISVQLRQAILVAGFGRQIDPKNPEPIIQEKYNWKKIQDNIRDIVFINSDNDPWKCDDKQGKFLFDCLGGTLIIRHGEGHMGSDRFKQPYKEFPLLLKLID